MHDISDTSLGISKAHSIRLHKGCRCDVQVQTGCPIWLATSFDVSVQGFDQSLSKLELQPIDYRTGDHLQVGIKGARNP